MWSLCLLTPVKVWPEHLFILVKEVWPVWKFRLYIGYSYEIFLFKTVHLYEGLVFPLSLTRHWCFCVLFLRWISSCTIFVCPTRTWWTCPSASEGKWTRVWAGTPTSLLQSKCCPHLCAPHLMAQVGGGGHTVALGIKPIRWLIKSSCCLSLIRRDRNGVLLPVNDSHMQFFIFQQTIKNVIIGFFFNPV